MNKSMWNHIWLYADKKTTCLLSSFGWTLKDHASTLWTCFSANKTPLKMFIRISLIQFAVNSVQWNHTCYSFLIFFFSEIPLWKNTSAGKKECNCSGENSRWCHLSSRWMSMASESSTNIHCGHCCFSCEAIILYSVFWMCYVKMHWKCKVWANHPYPAAPPVSITHFSLVLNACFPRSWVVT